MVYDRFWIVRIPPKYPAYAAYAGKKRRFLLRRRDPMMHHIYVSRERKFAIP
jgi:hypothetical protein